MNDGIILVGKKPPMSYVMSAMIQFNISNEVRIKARGRAISTAVDVAEIIKNRFVSNARIEDIKTGTDIMENERKQKLNGSTIELTLRK